MRDIRDPKALGEWILQEKAIMPSSTICSIADNARALRHPDYARDESTVQSTMAQYKDEMTAQAAQGDTAARIVCAEHAWAYGNACDAQNGSERRADVELEDEAMMVRQCKKDYAHLAHNYAVVAQPGVKAPVEMFRCMGRV